MAFRRRDRSPAVPRRPPPQAAASKHASWLPEAESAWRGPGVAGDRISYEPQPRAVRPGIGPERITPVQLVEPAAGGQGHRTENGPSLTVFAIVLDCLAVGALPALRDEVCGLLDVITFFTVGCVNPDRPTVGGRPRPGLDRLPAVEKGPRPGLANAERWLRHRGWRRLTGRGMRRAARSTFFRPESSRLNASGAELLSSQFGEKSRVSLASGPCQPTEGRRAPGSLSHTPARSRTPRASSPATGHAYAAQWRRFERWCAGQGRLRPSTPVPSTSRLSRRAARGKLGHVRNHQIFSGQVQSGHFRGPETGIEFYFTASFERRLSGPWCASFGVCT